MDATISLILLYTIVALFGVSMGSFLNSWMWRVHEHKWRLSERSVCVHCGRELRWTENIPLISFLVLRGRCRTCHQPIPQSYFWVELMMCVLFVWITAHHEYGEPGNYWHYLRNITMMVILMVTFVYDYKYMLVLSGLTWVGTGLGFLVNYGALGYSLPSLLGGVAFGGGFFALQYLVSRGRWVGGGDVRLGVMMGAWLGFPGVMVALLISYVLGALISVPLLISGKKSLASRLPFGTFLAVGTAIALWFGTAIITWYTSLFSW